MANISYISANKVRIYKDGAYLKTLTSAEFPSTQNTIDRQFIGDEYLYTLATTKEFGGTLNRDMVNEEFIETVLYNLITTKFTATNYDDLPDDIKYTLTDVSGPIDISFTTPASLNLVLDSVTLNVKRIGAFTGGLEIEIWEGLAGSGTLKDTLSIPEAEIETLRSTFLTANQSPESGEVTLTSNTAHTMRLQKTGTVTGSLEFYGPTAALEAYFAIAYETSASRQGNYTIDVVFMDNLGNEYITFRDTGITFLSNGVTINPGDPIGETLTWKASHRTVL